MSLYVVMRPTMVEEVHCVDAPYYNRLKVPATCVWTRVGRQFKGLDGARRLCASVGGYVKDLSTGSVVFDARDWAH